MDSSSSVQHHHQELGCSQTLESMLVCTKPQQEKKPRPTEQALNCPRCDSINTKFCYYNNYSLSQPRYFCKSCRRYWTKGGTLRNVPVGGGCRKNNRRPSSSSSTSSSSSLSSKKIQDQPMAAILNPILPSLNPLSFDSNDLNLSILGNPNMPHTDHHVLGSSGFNTSAGLFDSLRGGFLETPLGFHQNLYYGMGNGNVGLENFGIGMSGSSQEMGMQYDDYSGTPGAASITSTAVTTVKQEMRNIAREDESRVLWGFPWQNLGRNESIGEFDSSKLSWNGIGPSNWHGLLNSPLM